MSETESTPEVVEVLGPKAPQTLREFLEGREEALAGLIPRHLKAQTLINLALACVSRDSKLLACTPRSILQCVIQAAEVGLRPGVAGQVYLVPRWNSKVGGQEATFVIGYPGLIDLMLRNPRVQNVRAVLVRAGDEFSVEEGTAPGIMHRPAPWGADGVEGAGEVIGAYAVLHLEGGGFQTETMSRAQLDDIRDRFAPTNRQGNLVGPWASDQEEQQRKTVLRRLYKYAPRGIEVAGGDPVHAVLTMEDSGTPLLTSGEPVDVPEAALDPGVPAEQAADAAASPAASQGQRLANKIGGGYQPQGDVDTDHPPQGGSGGIPRPSKPEGGGHLLETAEIVGPACGRCGGTLDPSDPGYCPESDGQVLCEHPALEPGEVLLGSGEIVAGDVGTAPHASELNFGDK